MSRQKQIYMYFKFRLKIGLIVGLGLIMCETVFQQLGCCGANGPGDYKTSNFTRTFPTATVPVSCCALKAGPGIPTSMGDFVDLTSCQSSSPSDASVNKLVSQSES